jgi:Ca2+-binding RTX toxin-like protein
MLRRVTLLAATTLLLCETASGEVRATVGVPIPRPNAPQNFTLYVTGDDAGNSVAVTQDGVDHLVTSETDMVTAEEGCESIDAQTARCYSNLVQVTGQGGDDDLAATTTEEATLQGGPGRDVLTGGPGNESFDADAFDDISGGPGIDRVVYLGGEPISVDLEASDPLDGIEAVTTGSGDDVLLGTDGDDELNGGSGGHDRLVGRGGADHLFPGDRDLVRAGPGQDMVYRGRPLMHGDIDCGHGGDTLVARVVDFLVHGCESVAPGLATVDVSPAWRAQPHVVVTCSFLLDDPCEARLRLLGRRVKADGLQPGEPHWVRLPRRLPRSGFGLAATIRSGGVTVRGHWRLAA